MCEPSTYALYIMLQSARAVRGARTVSVTATVATLTRYVTKRPGVRSVLKASGAATVTRTSTNVSLATRVTNTPTVATQLAPSNVSALPDSRSSTPRPVRVRLDIHFVSLLLDDVAMSRTQYLMLQSVLSVSHHLLYIWRAVKMQLLMEAVQWNGRVLLLL